MNRPFYRFTAAMAASVMFALPVAAQQPAPADAAAAPAAPAPAAAAPAPANAAPAPAQDARITRAELAPGLYEIVYSPSQQALFVAAPGDPDANVPSRVLRLDPQTLAVQAEIALEKPGFGLALDDAANRLYVGATGDGAVMVVDTTTNKMTGSIQLAEKVKDADGDDSYPHNFRELALDPGAHRLYAAGLAPKDSALYVVNTDSQKVEKVLPGFGYLATGIAVDPAAKRVYLSNLQGQLFIIDSEKLETVKTVETGGDQLLNLALDAAAGRLYAIDEGHPFVTEFRKETLPDYKPKGAGNQVLVFDAKDGTELSRLETGKGPVALCLDAAAGRLFVTNRGDGSISVFGTADGKPVETVATGAHPNSLACNAGGGQLFVTIKSTDDAPEGSKESVARIGL